LVPYTTLFRSSNDPRATSGGGAVLVVRCLRGRQLQCDRTLLHVDRGHADIDLLAQLEAMRGRRQAHVDTVEAEFLAHIARIDHALNAGIEQSHNESTDGHTHDITAIDMLRLALLLMLDTLRDLM